MPDFSYLVINFFQKCCSSNKAAHIHYANMLMQYFAILNAVKIDNFHMKNMVVIICINFLFLLDFFLNHKCV